MSADSTNSSEPRPMVASSDLVDPALEYSMPLASIPVAAEPTAPADQATRDAQRTRRYFWSIISSLFTRPLSVVITLVSVPLFLKHLGQERYGLYESVAALAVWLGMTNAGMGLGLMNKLTGCYVSGDKQLARRYVSSVLLPLPIIAVVSILLLSLITPLVPWSSIFKTPYNAETAWGFWWAGVFALVGMVVSSGAAIYLGYQEIVRNNLWDAVSKSVTLIACITIVFTPLGVTGAIIATAGSPTIVRAINVLFIFGFEKPFLRPRRADFDWKLFRVLLTEGGCLLILQLSALALFQTDKLIIGIVRGAGAVTEFSVVGRLFLTAYGLFILLIGPLWPTAAEAIRRGDIQWVRRQLNRALLISSFGMLSVGIVMFFFGTQLVSLWTQGNQPTVSRALVAGLTVTFIARCWTECQSTILNAASVLLPQAWLLVTNAALNCAAAVILVYFYGAVGAAWSIPITTVLTSGWVYPLLIRKHIYSLPSATPATGAIA